MKNVYDSDASLPGPRLVFFWGGWRFHRLGESSGVGRARDGVRGVSRVAPRAARRRSPRDICSNRFPRRFGREFFDAAYYACDTASARAMITALIGSLFLFKRRLLPRGLFPLNVINSSTCSRNFRTYLAKDPDVPRPNQGAALEVYKLAINGFAP